MGSLIVSTQMTLDGVIDVGDWYVAEGEHDRAGKDQLAHASERTLHGPLEWNATLLEGDTSDAVAKLKAELPSDLLIYGCGELARALVAAKLVDELRFWIHPAVWGSGERPLQGETRNRLRLVGSDTFDSGVTLLRYAPIY